MKLQEYFNQLWENRLRDHEKFSLYQRISEQRALAEKSLKRTHIFFSKKLVYSCITLVLIIGFFGSYFWDNPYIQNYRAFFIERNPFFNTTNADQIASILEINGDYIIEKEGKQFKNSKLFDGDLITLKENAKIIFDINEKTQIGVQGPAQFRLSQKAEWGYLLKLINWNFLKIEANEDSSVLEVETDEMTIQTQQHQKTTFELSKENKKTQIKNTGAALLVKAKTPNKADTPITKLEKSKVLTMQDNDISKIEDIKVLGNLLTKEENITHTSVLSTGNTLPNVQEFISQVSELITGNSTIPVTPILTQEEATKISQEIEYQTDQKKVPTEAQLSQITAALNKGFLLSDMRALYEAKLSGDDGKVSNAYRLITSRIGSIAQAYEIKITAWSEQNQLLSMIDEVKKGLENYHLPPAKIGQLTTLKNWITFFNNFEDKGSWDAFSKQLPKELMFK